MAKSKSEKLAIVKELEQKIAESTGILVLAQNAVNPNEAAELKMKLAEIGGEYHVVKNSLFKLAVENAGLETLESVETGQNAVIFVGEKSPEAAKLVKEFIKEYARPKKADKLEFKQGFLEGKKLSAENAKALAELPSREQLLAQVVGTINAPLSGFVNVLAGNVRSIINVIDAYKNTKEA